MIVLFWRASSFAKTFAKQKLSFCILWDIGSAELIWQILMGVRFDEENEEKLVCFSADLFQCQCHVKVLWYIFIGEIIFNEKSKFVVVDETVAVDVEFCEFFWKNSKLLVLTNFLFAVFEIDEF